MPRRATGILTNEQHHLGKGRGAIFDVNISEARPAGRSHVATDKKNDRLDVNGNGRN